MDVVHIYGNTQMFQIGSHQMECLEGNLWKRGKLLHLPPSFKILLQPFREMSYLLSQWRVSALPVLKSVVTHKRLLSQYLKTGECGKHGSIAPFIKVTERHCLAEMALAAPHAHYWLRFLPGRIQLHSELRWPSPQMPHRARILCLMPGVCGGEGEETFLHQYKCMKFSI